MSACWHAHRNRSQPGPGTVDLGTADGVRAVVAAENEPGRGHRGVGRPGVEAGDDLVQGVERVRDLVENRTEPLVHVARGPFQLIVAQKGNRRAARRAEPLGVLSGVGRPPGPVPCAPQRALVLDGFLSAPDAIDQLERKPVHAQFPTLPAADAAYRQARADLDEHNQRLGGVQSRLASLKAELTSDDQVREAERNLRIAYRREAAATAGARVLREAADYVIESCIQPMAQEVRGWWKHLFTNNGLMFQADGSFTRFRDGVELGWDTLSGGERTWARIVTHLIVMGATTSLPFAWFDEPLEQLRHVPARASGCLRASIGRTRSQIPPSNRMRLPSSADDWERGRGGHTMSPPPSRSL